MPPCEHTNEKWVHIERTVYAPSRLWRLAYNEKELAKSEVGLKRADRCMVAILFSAFAFEAYLNRACETLLGASLWDALDKGRGMSMEKKLKIATLSLGLTDYAGREPFQTIFSVFQFRNSIAHAHTESVSGTVQVPLDTTGAPDSYGPYAPKTRTEEWCTVENAQKAVDAILEGANELMNAASEARRDGRIARGIGPLGGKESSSFQEVDPPD